MNDTIKAFIASGQSEAEARDTYNLLLEEFHDGLDDDDFDPEELLLDYGLEMDYLFDLL